MKLRLLVTLAALATATVAAQAQLPLPTQNRIGIYLTPMASRISNSTADTGVFAFLGDGNTSRFFEGFGVGVYDDFFHSNNVEAGLDLRGTILRSGGAQLSSFLIGGRVAYNSPDSRLKPYISVMGGVGGSKPAHNPLSVSKAQYGGAAGLDYKLGKHVDFRVVEVGYNSVTTVSSNAVNRLNVTQPASQLITFGTGLVFRIP